MSMYTNLKTDYSFLFSGMSGRSNTGGNFLGINLTEYASIKSGAYSKAVKAYYAKERAESVGSGADDDGKKTKRTRLKEDTAKKTLSEVKNDAGDLYSAASKLTQTGSKSLFTKKDITTTNEDGTKTTKNDYDRNAIYSAVNHFAKEYNKLLDSVGNSAEGSRSERTLSSMKNLTDVFKNQLGGVGITVGESGKLSVDEAAFKNADMTKVKGLFNGNNSYASNVAGYASTIGSYASSDLKYGSTYTASGAYSPYASGINYNSFF